MAGRGGWKRKGRIAPLLLIYETTTDRAVTAVHTGGVRTSAISVFYLCVCSLAYLKNHMSKLHVVFVHAKLLPCLSFPSTTMQYVMYFRFCGWRNVTVISLNESFCAFFGIQGAPALVICSVRYRPGSKSAIHDFLVRHWASSLRRRRCWPLRRRPSVSLSSTDGFLSRL